MSETDYPSDTLQDFTPEPAEPRRVVVLISGNGSNLQALIEAQEHDRLGGEIAAVVSNQPDAYGLKRARDAGIDAVALPHREYESREAFDGALIKVIERHEPDLVILAGFMRILTPRFVQRFLGRMLNIHPSLLPAYQGLHTHARALADGVTEHGCSVHFVTEELDGGPVALQAVVKVDSTDSEDSLKDKVQAREHLILPIAVNWFLEGRLKLSGDTVTMDGTPLPATGMRLSHDDAAEELDEDV
ncbi:phosphoribosylglycinamide formyltransferase [Halomonas elongata]|uniref:Phosphoribosylglycinamide formyltransferase n=1 Tax=Halomonas elongata (strain ATCC 33173 / DSM 2581 / NBRC 15536 / NCIMB 2198 / 1H9) TaxID=768066 RepID=E1VBB4_HALED|nr:phosphoribosylglycinamide formyltransferase [Halomonas elongata]MBW5798865.1 phosphoribosylglycinamide formyltransferase [Halomonas elongata]MDL4862615.1 phosphoribosylglycinamide formyltransferase [Halomonas elongata]RAW06513.1 phosphoribosylglycinamide formyltransferase [Halomonas elongata]WBF19443.1 phosphoribosylglycinamide formyltransferase [Halomonas elongata]WPU48304.1 phosphoribosylglycinamide formyltransferase [Halomonas elongata DSM 2581]